MADSPRPVLADSGVWFDLYNGKSTHPLHPRESVAAKREVAVIPA